MDKVEHETDNINTEEAILIQPKEEKAKVNLRIPLFAGLKKLQENTTFGFVAIAYFFSMFVLGISVMIANDPGVLAGTYEGSTATNGLNAFLWASVATLTFLFSICLAYFIVSKVRKKSYIEPK
ncbi:MAG: hypothetical protein FWE31_02845 [Firmicutes bacterium]|nr:hypothetical protein [Bacillota bacterium]